MTPILYAAAGLLLGGAIGYILFLRVLTSKAKSIVREAELEGESRKEKKMLQAKERFIELKEKQANQRKDLDRKLNDREDRIKKTEANLQRTIDQNKNAERQLKQDQEKLTQRLGALDKRQKDLDLDHGKAIDALEKLSGMTADDAKEAMVEQIKSEARAMAATQAQEIIDDAKEQASGKPRKLSSRPFKGWPQNTALKTAFLCSKSKTTTSRAGSLGVKEGTSARWKRPQESNSSWTTPLKPSS